jgi:hypothetical protein
VLEIQHQEKRWDNSDSLLSRKIRLQDIHLPVDVENDRFRERMWRLDIGRPKETKTILYT